jgi:glycosyltransferase involved in cell wall biosynthesis
MKSKLNRPKVTVLISVYNGEKWVGEAIDSVINQTFKNFEIIAVNDGSTDRTKTILKKYAEIDQRVKLVDKEKSGLTDSLNLGLFLARGEWIARMDADDLSVSDRIEKQHNLVNSNLGLNLVGSGMYRIDENGIIKGKYIYPKMHGQLLDKLMGFESIFPHSSAFIKLVDLLKVGGYRIRFKKSQDYDLWMRLSEIGKIFCIDEPLVKIRKHSQQISYEDGGRRQSVYAMIAAVSYFLRKSQQSDPVDQNASNQIFEKFYDYVERKMDLYLYFKYCEFVSEIKAALQYGGLINGLKIAKIISADLSAFKNILAVRYQKNTMPKRIANSWIVDRKTGKM